MSVENLNIIYNALIVAQKRGAFNIEEAATLAPAFVQLRERLNTLRGEASSATVTPAVATPVGTVDVTSTEAGSLA